MSVSYDVFTEAFLQKVIEFGFPDSPYEANRQVDGYMKRAIANFKKVCAYNLSSTADDAVREFDLEIKAEDLDELVEIISEGMTVQWLKPYVFNQENLENMLSTKDFTSYSPAELLNRVKSTYEMAKKDYKNRVKSYSYDHGDLTELSI